MVGLGIGIVAGGLAGFAVWRGSDHDYGYDCWFCGVEVAGYIGIGALFGGVAGGIVGAVLGED